VNFTQGGYNIQANSQRNGACVVKTVIAGKTVASICTQSVFDKGPCEDNAGVWWGPGYDSKEVINATGHAPDVGYRSCWQVNQSEHKASLPLTPIAPEITMAVRNDFYKLVRNTTQTYDTANDTGGPVTKDEFYAIDQKVPTPTIDKSDLDLMPGKATWSAALLATYTSLKSQLEAILASQPACPGDGNMDNQVDALDTSLWTRISNAWKNSSMFDFNFDGKTDAADLALINQNAGACKKSSAIY
jgi:hypothetical protein